MGCVPHGCSSQWFQTRSAHILQMLWLAGSRTSQATNTTLLTRGSAQGAAASGEPACILLTFPTGLLAATAQPMDLGHQRAECSHRVQKAKVDLVKLPPVARMWWEGQLHNMLLCSLPTPTLMLQVIAHRPWQLQTHGKGSPSSSASRPEPHMPALLELPEQPQLLLTVICNQRWPRLGLGLQQRNMKQPTHCSLILC